MRITKEQKGITLIALVITIIVLLILAGVALATLTGNGSIIDNANYAVGEYNKSANADQNEITKVEDLFAKYLEGDAEYKITYNANGGTGTMNEETASSAGTSTFTPPEGKVFKEWNTLADGSGTSYAAGETVPSDVTLYAIWVTEAIQQQYGNLVNEQEDTINPDLFTWTALTEPGVAVVRHTSDGTVSRGDTPAVTTQKGTAKITGINWNWFVDDNFTVTKTADSAGSTIYTINVKTQTKKETVENALRKLIVPYEVTKTENNITKTYTVTAIDGEILSTSDINFAVPENSGYKIPNIIAGSEAAYHGQATTSGDTSYLIIPTSVTSIGNLNLLPRNQILFSSSNGITQITNYMFKNSFFTSQISLPAGITSIGDEAFMRCKVLGSIDIPDTVTTIGELAFYNCFSLTTLRLPNNLTAIRDRALEGCERIQTIEYKGTTYKKLSDLLEALSDNNVTIGDEVFYKIKLENDPTRN